MKKMKIAVILVFSLVLSVALFAQHGRGRNGNYNRYKQNRGNVSVTIGPRYNYRPNYRPYYRSAPRYRPVYRPVYRPLYRPVYRRPYTHYGPVFGIRVNVLPYGYSRIYAGTNPYYYNDGIYYRSYNNTSSYEVVAPPLNATVNKLPSNATVTVIDGQKYYQVGGTFYQEEISDNNRPVYRVVGTDGVLSTQSGMEEQPVEESDLTAYDEAIPTLGSRYDELPADTKVQVINQQKYLVSPAGVYYKEVVEGDKLRYEVTTVE